MDSSSQRINDLFQKLLSRTCSQEELREFMDLMRTEDTRNMLTEPMQSVWEQQEITAENIRSEKMFEAISRVNEKSDASNPVHKVRFIKTAWFRYAVVVILLFTAGASLWYRSFDKKVETALKQAVPRLRDIAPGGNKAILTLSDGTSIMLDSAAVGDLAQQGNTRILKPGAGSLTYESNAGKVSPSAAAGEALYNTVSTPKGGQYQVTLPDGTKVWLNAASSLTYPTVFNSSQRKVTMKGEAYFEIAKSISQPFIVQVNNSEIEVLGTHFNVMAYNNENTLRTTLLEGAVRFTAGKKSVLLKPGQQSSLSADNAIQLTDRADVEVAVAWKNGIQSFNGADIRTIMRQVERWYDLDVTYAGAMPYRTFSGNIPRAASLSKLLKLFEVSKIHFELDEAKKKLTVKP